MSVPFSPRPLPTGSFFAQTCLLSSFPEDLKEDDEATPLPPEGPYTSVKGERETLLSIGPPE